MTFPSPFDPSAAPALDAVVEASSYDRANVQAVADSLVKAVVDAYKADQMAQRSVKTKLTRAVQAPTKKDRVGVFNPLVNTMLAAQQTALQNDDAEMMLLLPRIGQVAAQATTPPGFTVIPAPGAGSASTPPTSAPAPGTCWPDPSRPGCYFCFDGRSLTSWCPGDAPPGVPSPTPAPTPFPDPGPIPVPIPPPAPVPYPVPPPIPPPAVCPPCAPEIVPGGSKACPVGMPENATFPSPWLQSETATPGLESECGRKAVLDTAGEREPAAELVQALATDDWATQFLGSLRIPGTPPLPRERVDYEADTSGDRVFLLGGSGT
jgi:hypothetical protein